MYGGLITRAMTIGSSNSSPQSSSILQEVLGLPAAFPKINLFYNWFFDVVVDEKGVTAFSKPNWTMSSISDSQDYVYLKEEQIKLAIYVRVYSGESSIPFIIKLTPTNEQYNLKENRYTIFEKEISEDEIETKRYRWQSTVNFNFSGVKNYEIVGANISSFTNSAVTSFPQIKLDIPYQSTVTRYNTNGSVTFSNTFSYNLGLNFVIGNSVTGIIIPQAPIDNQNLNSILFGLKSNYHDYMKNNNPYYSEQFQKYFCFYNNAVKFE